VKYFFFYEVKVVFYQTLEMVNFFFNLEIQTFAKQQEA